jgi:hypothetical protein
MNNPFIFIIIIDTNILPLVYVYFMYRLLIKKTNYLILIEWPREIFDDNNVGRFKGQ